jgi:glutaredoxin
MRLLLYTQPGCISCELIKVLLEAKGVAFEERDIIADAEARRDMVDVYDSRETPTLVLFEGEEQHVITGFDPDFLDQIFSASSPDSKDSA